MRLEGSDSYPIWSNQRSIALVAMLSVPVPDNDLVDDNPLPYGHTAFTEDDCELWVCRLWIEGSPVAYVTLQTTPEMRVILALHDWRFDDQSERTFEEAMLCLVASAQDGLTLVGISEDRQAELNRLFGPVLFDMHNNARIHWSDYERHQQRYRKSL